MQKRYDIVDRRIVETDNENALITVFINPDAEEKKHLVEALKLDEHTLNSALDPDELARMEFEPEHMAVIFKRPRNYSGAEQFLFKVSSAGAFLFKDRLVVVLPEDVPLFDGAQFSRFSSPAGLILRLISRSIIHFREHLKVISMISDELQDKIHASMDNKYLLNMFTLQKSLVYYVNSINSNGALIEKLRNYAGRIGFTTDELEFLDDILIENSQCNRQADIFSNILASLMDARASIVSNNLNVLMKTLNIITICIMLPTLVVSIFSMNVPLPVSQEHVTSFWFIMVLAFFSMATVLYIWRLKRW
ncbi:MAG: magnesium transporter CorA family protein [Candidatus Sumerlaeia bacterium]|nr:magnesium transporter CorA family protein [Candidatus Sumerlaeia bacterium]